jgi:hypothetical protein
VNKNKKNNLLYIIKEAINLIECYLKRRFYVYSAMFYNAFDLAEIVTLNMVISTFPHSYFS